MKEIIFVDNLARFGVIMPGITRKIFYYFVQADRSIGVGSYCNANASFVSSPPMSSPLKVNIKECEEKMTSFVPHKTSFHISGIMTIKNKKGERPLGDKDLKSVGFKSIVDPLQIRVTYPTHLDQYKEIKDEVVNYFISDEVKPIMIKIFLSPSDYEFYDWMTSIDKDSVIFVDKASLEIFGVFIYVVFRNSNNKFIPKYETVADLSF